MRILDIFKNRSQKDTAAGKHAIEPNIITFSIDEWDRCSIEIKLNNNQEKISSNFGKMLYAINTGLYEAKILDTIVDISKKNPMMSETIKNILSAWGLMLTKNLTNDTAIAETPVPYIKPTEVFRVK